MECTNLVDPPSAVVPMVYCRIRYPAILFLTLCFFLVFVWTQNPQIEALHRNLVEIRIPKKFSVCIMATSFSGGRNRSTRREPPTIGKQLV
jgi:hypothetical protein